MPIIDFDSLGKVISISNDARTLLERSEMEMTLRLDFSFGSKSVSTDLYVVYYNTVRGPAKGGIRMSPEVTLDSIRDLAEIMTYKTALVNIPFGGGKSAIKINPKEFEQYELNDIIREYVRLLKREIHPTVYIPSPDVGTGPREMMVIYGETHMPESVTGKPVTVGGIPGRESATGWGVATSAKFGVELMLNKSMFKRKVAIQGFGKVGPQTALFLKEMGALIVGVSDTSGGIYDSAGLNVEELIKHKESGRPVQEFGSEKISGDDLLTLDVDMLVLAALENAITEENAPDVKADLIVEGANKPITAGAEKILKNTTIIPDIFASSGGVIASYIEWHQGKSGSLTEKEEIYATIDKAMHTTFYDMLTFAKENKVNYRTAALSLALRKILSAMQDRGWI